jgi:hypothetical protein
MPIPKIRLRGASWRSRIPDLFVLRRGLNDRGKPRREIAVDDARELGHFFSLAPSEGGMRVAIIDAVDDLNRNAANAILKTLEEPPARPSCCWCVTRLARSCRRSGRVAGAWRCVRNQRR